jgi:signal transduction histidine kinase
MTIPQRILTHVAIGAGIVIAVATAVTYELVYDGATQRDLKHLETYVRERTRREEIGFKQVEVNLNLVRGMFLRRMESGLPGNYDTIWNARFELFPDGAWRSRTNFADGRKYSTLWAHKNVNFTPELKIQVLRAQNICDELLRGWADEFSSVYFVLPGWLNIGFDPRIPSWVWDTPASYNATNLEWFTLAMPAEKPADRFNWTGVIEEPTTKVPIVSVYLPILKDGKFLGSIGHDKYLNRLMDETAKSDLSGARHVIFRSDGRIMAHPTKLKEILASKGQLRMQNSGEPELASLYHAISGRTERQFSGFDEASGLYYSVARLAGPEWFFVTTMPRELLQKQAFQSAQWVLWSGLISLALVLAFLAATLRREVARPLAELTRATKQMSGGDIRARTVVRRGGELGALANSFNEMAGRVASRDAELRQLNQDLEQRVAQRTAELTEANRRLDERREEALQLLARERELRELKSNFVSLVSHEFRTPLEIIMSSVDNLDRYHDRLPLEKRQHLLRTINDAVRRMAGMMEEVLVLGRLETDRMTFKPEPFELRSFCQRVSDEIESAMDKRCPIQLQVNGTPEQATGDESLLRHIFTNLLSNAVKYSPPGQTVEFALHREGASAVCRISDRGCGIPETDQKRLFQAFHRGSNVQQVPGTGLGLMIVQRCVELHGGHIQFESAEGRGTTFTITLPLFPPTQTPTPTLATTHL